MVQVRSTVKPQIVTLDPQPTAAPREVYDIMTKDLCTHEHRDMTKT